MNEKLNFIFSRRSIRKYEDKPIEDDLLNDLLEAGMAGPSAMTKDPWHFLVVKDKDKMKAVANLLPNGKMLADAAVLILVLGDINQTHGNLESYMIQDCIASVENILLSANALNLGACWLGFHPKEDRINGIKEMFSLPENIIPITGISLGYPAEEKEKRTRFNKDLVHLEKW